MTESSQIGSKTLWKKEKLLVTNNFFFSHSIFKRLVLETSKNKACSEKDYYVRKSTDWRLFVFMDMKFNNNNVRLISIPKIQL